MFYIYLTLHSFIYFSGMIETTKRHTAENLKEEIIKCLTEYGISINQIYSSTTDNGANVVKMSKLLQEMQQDNICNDEDIKTDFAESNNIQSQIASVFSVVRCAAHTIQLAAYDVLKTLEGDIKECRNIVKKLRTSVRSGSIEISLPCLDNVTRWNSTYDMINSILSIRDYIENVDSASHINVNWIFVQNFLAAFHPIAECTLKLQHEQYIIGDFLEIG